MKVSLRSQTSYSTTTLQVDRKAAKITNVVAMQIGEAQGHRMEADLTTLQLTANLGNANPKGIRGRLGHPGVSENTTGKQVQIASGFSVVGDKLVHTSQLLQTARKSPAFAQDPVEWILDVAEKNPTELGESVVIDTGAVWKLADGSEIDAFDSDGDFVKRPENAMTKYPVMRPVHLHMIDFVNEGALTPDGLFSQKTQFFAEGTSRYAEQLFDIVDEWRSAYRIKLDEVPHKVTQMLDAYLESRRKVKMNDNETNVDGTESATEAQTTQESSQVHQEAQESLAAADRIISALTKTEKVETVASTARLQALEEQVAQLSTALSRQSKALEAMFIHLQTLSGEPVGRDKVSRQPLQSFAPPQELSVVAPTHVSDRSKNQPSVSMSPDPLVAAGQRQVSRNQRQVGMGG